MSRELRGWSRALWSGATPPRHRAIVNVERADKHERDLQFSGMVEMEREVVGAKFLLIPGRGRRAPGDKLGPA